MKLENTIKFFSPKSPSLSDSPCATGGGRLTNTDVMAALGMCQATARFGLSAFLGKVDISNQDKQNAVEELTRIGMRLCVKSKAISKLTPAHRVKVVKLLATFAYAEYCRSAAGVTECLSCKGRGIIDTKEVVVKSHYVFQLPDWAKDELKQSPSTAEIKREVTEKNHRLCTKCNGKGVVSVACKDCKGRGMVVDKKQSQAKGVSVTTPCKRCSGLGYGKVNPATVYRAVKAIISELPKTSWQVGYKPLFNQLVSECYAAESVANDEINKITHD